MSWTRVVWFAFALAFVCLLTPAAQAQTNISLSFSSGSLALYSDYGVGGFQASDGLSLNFGNVAYNGTDYTDTNGALSFVAGGDTFSGLPVSGVTSQSSSGSYFPVYYTYYYSCGFFSTCWYNYVWGYVSYGSSSDSVDGTFAPGTPIEIGGNPFQITSGSFDFSYGNSYQNGCCGYYSYNDNYFYGGNINLTATPDPVVPEPSTCLTMGTGLLLLAGIFRRKLLKDPSVRTRTQGVVASA